MADARRYPSRLAVAPPEPGTVLVEVDPSCVIDDYGSFVEAMISKRHRLGWTTLETEDRSGLHSGYVTKLENWQGPQGRIAGRVALPLWLGALGIRLLPIDVAPVIATGPCISLLDLTSRVDQADRPWVLRRARRAA